VRPHKGNVFIDLHQHSLSSPRLQSFNVFYIALQFSFTESLLSRDPLHVTALANIAAKHGAERSSSVPVLTL
jgi:hypothetical protein